VSEIVLLQQAQSDLLEIYARFGDSSYHAIDRALERLRENPKLGTAYHGTFRRKLVLKTPFGIFYSIVGDRLMITAVLDLRQNLDILHRQLGIQES